MKQTLMIGVLLLTAASAQAGLVYDNGAPDGLNGNEMTEWIQAEDFTLGSATILTDVRFWGALGTDSGTYAGSIVWSLYADNSGEPGTLLDRGSVVPTEAYDHDTTYGTSYQYDFSLGSINLDAGTYWLGLHNGPLAATDRLDFYWETTSGNLTVRGNEDHVTFDDGYWSNNNQEHAFQLFDGGATVPAPGALLLGGIGMSLVGWLRRNRAL